MENASKALIIAGAILLAILLISLGIMIFNQAQDTVNSGGMSQADITSFNNKFLKYEGDNQSASVAKSLINEVLSSNADSSNAQRQVVVLKGSSSVTSTSDISSSKKYKIEISEYASQSSDTVKTTKGCVYKIKLTEKNS